MVRNMSGPLRPGASCGVVSTVKITEETLNAINSAASDRSKLGERPEQAPGVRATEERTMTLARKGSRGILVDGIGYSWKVRHRPTDSQGLG